MFGYHYPVLLVNFRLSHPTSSDFSLFNAAWVFRGEYSGDIIPINVLPLVKKQLVLCPRNFGIRCCYLFCFSNIMNKWESVLDFSHYHLDCGFRISNFPREVLFLSIFTSIFVNRISCLPLLKIICSIENAFS